MNPRFTPSIPTEKELAPEEQRKIKKNEFRAKYGRYWLVYLALIITASLSVAAGILLPLKPAEDGTTRVTFFTIIACIFYAIGFLATGEGAAYYWFDKLVDHDPDNSTQIVLAVAMLIAAVVTSLTTAMAAGTFIAYLLGAMTVFDVMPIWAQNWVVYAIPIMLTIHAVCGMIFKAISDEASSERKAKAQVRQVKNKMAEQKASAYASWFATHAPQQAAALGKMQAQRELDEMSAKLGQGSPVMQPAAFDVPRVEEKQENPLSSTPPRK